MSNKALTKGNTMPQQNKSNPLILPLMPLADLQLASHVFEIKENLSHVDLQARRVKEAFQIMGKDGVSSVFTHSLKMGKLQFKFIDEGLIAVNWNLMNLWESGKYLTPTK